MDVDEERNGWLPDPFGRFEERYLVYGEPSRLVRSGGVEQTDQEPFPSAAQGSSNAGLPVVAVDPPVVAVDLPAVAVDASVTDDAVRARPRRVRARALAAVAIVLAATLVVCLASAIRGDRSADSTVGRATRPQADAPTAPSAAGSPSPIAAWIAMLEADVNNINEVAYDYGHGTLEGTACRRTRDDATKPPGARVSSDLAAAVAIARDDIVTFAGQCADNFSHVCRPDSRNCPRARLADGYRRSLRALNTVRADMRRTEAERSAAETTSTGARTTHPAPGRPGK